MALVTLYHLLYPQPEREVIFENEDYNIYTDYRLYFTRLDTPLAFITLLFGSVFVIQIIQILAHATFPPLLSFSFWGNLLDLILLLFFTVFSETYVTSHRYNIKDRPIFVKFITSDNHFIDAEIQLNGLKCHMGLSNLKVY